MKALFVTATGTDVGKTYVSCILARQLRAKGLRVAVLKPVISGFTEAGMATSDTGLLLEAAGMAVSAGAIEAASPWRFAAPLSPDMAAAREGRSVPFGALIEACRAAREGPEDALLIEGVGGAMVPLDADHTIADWIAALDGQAVIVAGSYLGTISHTLTTLAALRAHGVAVAGIVLSESPDSPVALAETARSIGRFSGGVPLTVLPRGVSAETAPDLTGLMT